MRAATQVVVKKPPISKTAETRICHVGTPKGTRTIIAMGEVKGMKLSHVAIAPLGSLTKTPKDNMRSEEHTSELQSRENLVCRLLLEKKKNTTVSKYQTTLA